MTRAVKVSMMLGWALAWDCRASHVLGADWSLGPPEPDSPGAGLKSECVGVGPGTGVA